MPAGEGLHPADRREQGQEHFTTHIHGPGRSGPGGGQETGKASGAQPTPEELRERRKRYKAASYERIRAALGGRQAAVLKAYKKANGLTVQTMADRVGVSRVVMSKWMEERQIANWDKLAALGIQKPEGLPEGLGRGRKTT